MPVHPSPPRGHRWSHRVIHCLSSLCREGIDAIDGHQEEAPPLAEVEVNCVSACCQSRATETIPPPPPPHNSFSSLSSSASSKSLNENTPGGSALCFADDEVGNTTEPLSSSPQPLRHHHQHSRLRHSLSQWHPVDVNNNNSNSAVRSRRQVIEY